MNYARYRHGELKGRMAALRVGDTIVVPAYLRAGTPEPKEGRVSLRPAPKAMGYGRLYGYSLEVAGYGELAGKPVAFVRRRA